MVTNLRFLWVSHVNSRTNLSKKPLQSLPTSYSYDKTKASFHHF
jgi:hypothetical protein